MKDAEGPYKPVWESLDRHSAPEWFDDAKLGMFVDWGLYSVAGWAARKPQGAMYPDWYLFNMYREEARDYHKKTWGESFERDDFISLFTARKYNAEALAELALGAGMKYIVPFCKHHDGFCLWDCSHTERDAVDMGPKRDLIRPMVEACRARGLKFGFYFSVDEWEYPTIDEQGAKHVRLWGQGPVRVMPYDKEEMRGKIGGKRPVRDFVAEYIVPQAKEFIVKYDPDILWFDGEWDLPPEARGTWDITAFFYNNAEGRKAVAVNDRFGAGTRARHGDFFTSEFHDGNLSLTHKWEECRPIGQSYGYNREDEDDNVLSSAQLIQLFVDTVSQGGNLLLIVNLTGPGALAEMEVTRLNALGAWLKVNGEAIYATRRHRVTREGDTRYTQSKDGKYVYAILPAWPEEPVVLNSVRAVPGSEIRILGLPHETLWTQDDDALTVTIPGVPAGKMPCECAYALRIEAGS